MSRWSVRWTRAVYALAGAIALAVAWFCLTLSLVPQLGQIGQTRGARGLTLFVLVCLLAAALCALAALGLGALGEKKSRLAVLGLMLVTAAPRALVIVFVTLVPQSDFERYHITANSLLEGYVFMSKYVAVFPHSFGYPAFLSVFYRIFGSNPAVAQWLNVVLSCLCSFLIYKIGRELLGARRGLVAGVLWALFPSQIFLCALVCAEIVFIAGMLGVVWLFIWMARRPRGKNPVADHILWIFVGILAGIISAIRPLSAIFVVAFCLYILFWGRNDERAKPRRVLAERGLVCLVIVAGYLAASASLSALIEQKVGRETAGSVPGWNLFVGLNEEHFGMYNTDDQEVFSEVIDSHEDAAEIQKIFARKAGERLKSFDGLVPLLRLAKEKFTHTWAWDDNAYSWLEKSQDPLANDRIHLTAWTAPAIALTNGYWLVMLLLCVWAGVRVVRRPGSDGRGALLVVLFIGLVLFLLLVEANPRYHYPANALMALWAAMALPGARKGGADA